MSTLTLQQALDQLRTQSSQFNSVQALYDFAKQVNVDATGNVTILYSGQTTAYEGDGKPLVTPLEKGARLELKRPCRLEQRQPYIHYAFDSCLRTFHEGQRPI